nr:uncharacterized protein LOC109406852 isoform X2 [Aedes albopictus]
MLIRDEFLLAYVTTIDKLSIPNTTSMIEQRNTMQVSVLATTTDPSQFADVVRQGVPMDLTCVRAVPEVLKALNINIPTLVINVHVDGSTPYRFGTLQNSSGDDGLVIDLVLRDNHYQLRGLPEEYQSSHVTSEDNNCLYDALVRVIPQLTDVTGPEFRRKLADYIETNPDIRRHIQLGKHQTLLQGGVYGGLPPSRRRSNSIHEDPTNETPCAKHLVDRFEAIFLMAGIIQYCSESMGIPRDEVLCTGASLQQDRNSADPYLHAAHVTRMQISARVEAMKHSHPVLYEYLTTLLGYTQLVEIWANMWGGVGQDIDLIQGDLISLLEVIDFNQNPPTLVQNYSLAKLKKLVEKINAQLQRRNKNATVITLPDTITATSIAEICRQAYTAVLQYWIDHKQKKIDDAIFNENKVNRQEFVDGQLVTYDIIHALHDARDCIRKKDKNKLLKPSNAEEFILRMKQHCTEHKDNHFVRDDYEDPGDAGAARCSKRSKARKTKEKAASEKRKNREKCAKTAQVMYERPAETNMTATVVGVGLIALGLCGLGVVAGAAIIAATATTATTAAVGTATTATAGTAAVAATTTAAATHAITVKAAVTTAAAATMAALAAVV